MSGRNQEPDAAVAAIREEYVRRAAAPQCAGQYSLLNPAHAALVLERERVILRALSRHLDIELGVARVLDVGCGFGVSLALLAAYGADPSLLAGVDVMEDRIDAAGRRYPVFDLRVGSGRELPWPDESFDVVQQITMLSSVHDDDLRRALAAEMARVLRPGGLVLSYDVVRTPLPARALNFVLGRWRRPAVAALTPGGEPKVTLTPVRPIGEPELRGLFQGLEPVEATRLSPYRPLVERLSARPLPIALLGLLPGTSTGLLFVAQKPTGAARMQP